MRGVARGKRGPALAEEELESGQVDLLGLNCEHIPTSARQQLCATERLAQVRDVDAEAVQGARGRAAVPEGVDRAVGGDVLPRIQEEKREQRALLSDADT